MGRTPIPLRNVRPPTRESFHLGIARSAYLSENLSLEEFECSVEHVLAGGTLTQNGQIPQFPRPTMEERR